MREEEDRPSRLRFRGGLELLREVLWLLKRTLLTERLSDLDFHKRTEEVRDFYELRLVERERGFKTDLGLPLECGRRPGDLEERESENFMTRASEAMYPGPSVTLEIFSWRRRLYPWRIRPLSVSR